MTGDARVLPDVNILLAYGWRQHPFHAQCSSWIDALSGFATCPITELGFMRVSMSPAFRASYDDASRMLAALTQIDGAQFLPCDLPAERMSVVSRYKDTTDAYLVSLAKNHSYRFATLDEGILKERWASGVAYNPIAM